MWHLETLGYMWHLETLGYMWHLETLGYMWHLETLGPKEACHAPCDARSMEVLYMKV